MERAIALQGLLIGRLSHLQEVKADIPTSPFSTSFSNQAADTLQ